MATTQAALVASLFGGTEVDDLTTKGGTASKADGGTIAHGIVDRAGVAAVPRVFTVQATVAGHIATATATSTNLVVALKNHDGMAVAVAENVVWSAQL